MRTFVTSDLHFFHANSISFTNRPFASVEEMTEGLISRWNAVVSEGDSVYVLGDFSFGKHEETLSIFNRLNGNKMLLVGNHDHKATKKLPWCWVKDAYGLRYTQNGFNEYIWLSHYAHMSWNRSYHGSKHFFGHYHSTGNMYFAQNSCDIGTDYWDLAPVNVETVINHIEAIKQLATQDYYFWKGKDLSSIEFLNIPL